MLEFLKRILKSAIENWLVSLLSVVGFAIGGGLLWFYREYLKDWLLSIWYVEMAGWAWMLIFAVVFLLVASFICGIIEKFGRLKNERDIVKAIEDWFTNGDEYGYVPELKTPYSFAGVEKSLNIKRGSSKIYLPSVAMKHGYSFDVGERTFTLAKEN